MKVKNLVKTFDLDFLGDHLSFHSLFVYLFERTCPSDYANIKNNRSERDLCIYDLCICDLYHMHFTLKIIIFNANEGGMFLFLPVQATDRLKTEAELAKQDEERLKKLEVSSTQSSPS